MNKVYIAEKIKWTPNRIQSISSGCLLYLLLFLLLLGEERGGDNNNRYRSQVIQYQPTCVSSFVRWLVYSRDGLLVVDKNR